MKKLLPLLFAIIYCSAQAQQDPLYSQYLNNPIVLNPAYAGINDVFTASVGYRGQWNGLEGAPTTLSATAHSSFLDNKVGGGLVIIRDELGITTNTQINMTGSYKIEFGDNIFSFGMQFGVNSYRDDNGELAVRDAGDALFEGSQSFTKTNFGAGAILKGSNYFVGLSVPRLVNSKEEFGNVESEIFSRHYYLGLGYVFLLNTSLSLKTGALVKAVSDVPASVDLSSSLLFLDRYSAGILTRNFETYGIILGALLKENIRFNYTFEVPTNQSVGTQFNTHEIGLSIDLELLDGHFIKERYF
ncbi:PorP/SprF family type IX secretion system membrane protein [Fulvivirga lutea]|uniref:Type IX secretion system membrane protein PorP/SprF n=1 Tax=Fulvivirga lutea TaxID=2810512 RepID=A0A974WIZ6_9BACT|nr:type IX secretion system membrane protein PorP/SprF [Fulvivirga lutea]QSE96213.1 type IX secretion system membrane protein PorP/SprF [Fulvivirga lutea]